MEILLQKNDNHDLCNVFHNILSFVNFVERAAPLQRFVNCKHVNM